MNIIYTYLIAFNPTLFLKLLSEASPEFIVQYQGFIVWTVVISVGVPIVIAILMFIGRIFLYQVFESYRKRQYMNTAISNIICKIRDESKWTDSIREMIETEYESVNFEKVIPTTNIYAVRVGH